MNLFPEVLGSDKWGLYTYSKQSLLTDKQLLVEVFNNPELTILGSISYPHILENFEETLLPLPDKLIVKGNLDLSYGKYTRSPVTLYVQGNLNISYSNIKISSGSCIAGNLICFMCDTVYADIQDNVLVGGKILGIHESSRWVPSIEKRCAARDATIKYVHRPS